MGHQDDDLLKRVAHLEKEVASLKEQQAHLLALQEKSSVTEGVDDLDSVQADVIKQADLVSAPEQPESPEKKEGAASTEAMDIPGEAVEETARPDAEVVDPARGTFDREKSFLDERVSATSTTETATTTVAQSTQSARPKPRPKKEFNLEKTLSRFLPKVFMFILILGVLWGLKVATDLGYVTNAIRIVGGYAGAGLLYYFGLKMYKQQNKAFSYTLLGGVIALGILTTFAAYHLYGYFNYPVAFIVGVFFIVLGLYLAKRTKSEVLTIFSAIAGFLLPFLLEDAYVSVYGFCAYVFILFISLFYVALTDKHKYTFYFTFLLFHLTFAVYMLMIGMNIPFISNAVVITILLQHFVLLFIYFMERISRHAFTEALIYTNFIFTLGWVKLLNATQETWTYGGLAVFYLSMAIYTFMKKEKVRGVFSAVAVIAITAYLFTLTFNDFHTRVILLLLNGMTGIAVGIRYRTIRTIITGSMVYVPTIFFIFSFVHISKLMSIEHLVWLVLLGSIAVIFYVLYRYPPKGIKNVAEGTDRGLIFAQLVVYIYIIRLTDFALQDHKFFLHTPAHIYLLVSMVTFVAMYACYKFKRGKYVAHAGVIAFLMLGLPMIGQGLQEIGQNWFIFNLAVQIMYVALLTMMFIWIAKDKFYYRSKSMQKNIPALALVLQFIIFIFFNKWYFLVADFYDIEYEYMLLIHTFLLFIFAFGSISIGGRFGWKPVKYFGAVLILLCIIKLFFVDLISVSILIRAILFIIVGIVGLIYSRTLFKEAS